MVDADGVRATFEHDADGQLVGDDRRASGDRTTIRYDAAGLPVETVDAAGGVTRLANDDAGRLVESVIGDDVDPLRLHRRGPSAVGRRRRRTVVDRHVRRPRPPRHVHRRRGVHGRLRVGPVRQHRRPSSRPTGGGSATCYDEANQLVGAVRPRRATRDAASSTPRAGSSPSPTRWRNRWRRELDVLGRTVVSIAPDGARTRYEYDAAGPRRPRRAPRRPRRCRPSTTSPAGSSRSSTSSGPLRVRVHARPAGSPSGAGRPAGSSVGRTTRAGRRRHRTRPTGSAPSSSSTRSAAWSQVRRTRRPGPSSSRAPNGDLLGASRRRWAERVRGRRRRPGRRADRRHRRTASTYAWDRRGQLDGGHRSRRPRRRPSATTHEDARPRRSTPAATDFASATTRSAG